MVLGPYRVLLGAPRVAAVMLASQLGRLPLGMTGFAVVLFVHQRTGSFGWAGAATAALGAAAAVTTPYLGHLADRLSWTRVLVPCALAELTALSALVLLGVADAPRYLLPVAAAAAGAARPPLAACTRALWPRLVQDRALLDAAYGIEGAMVEVVFVLGPLLVVALGTVDPAAAVLTAAVLSVAGSVSFAALSGDRHLPVLGAPRPAWGALASPGMRVVFAASLLVGVAFGTLEVGLPAFAAAQGNPADAGLGFAAMAAAGLVSGLAYGARRWTLPLHQRYLTFLTLFAAGLLPLSLAGSVPELTVLMGLAGLALAPMYAASYALIDHVAPRTAVTEAYAWATTANVGGTALGAAATGALVEQLGVRPVLSLTAALAALAALIAYTNRRKLTAA